MDLADMLEAARTADVLTGLDGEELADLAGVASRVSLPEGDLLFAEGDPGDGMYLIGAGTVRIGKGQGLQPRQFRRFLATLGPGDVFGEVALLLDQPRSAGAIATTPCELYRITRASFNQLLDARTALAWKLLTNLARNACRRLTTVDQGLLGLEQRAEAERLGPSDIADVHARVFNRPGLS